MPCYRLCRWPAFAALVLFWAVTCFPIAADDSTPVPFNSDDPYRTRAICGVNSLYMFLRLHGHHVSFADVQRVLPPKPTGNSVLELQRAAKALGVPTIALECPSFTSLA